MIVCLDTNIMIYLIEQPPVWGPRAASHLAGLRSAGAQLAVSDLTRMECRVGPLRTKNATLLAQYDHVFTAPDQLVLPLTGQVCDRAAVIRADYGFSTPDALNLAAAVEASCAAFLTNDARLSRFPALTVEVLP